MLTTAAIAAVTAWTVKHFNINILIKNLNDNDTLAIEHKERQKMFLDFGKVPWQSLTDI